MTALPIGENVVEEILENSHNVTKERQLLTRLKWVIEKRRDGREHSLLTTESPAEPEVNSITPIISETPIIDITESPFTDISTSDSGTMLKNCRHISALLTL